MNLNTTKELVDRDGKPKRRATSPVIPQRGMSNPHTVLDVHWTTPHRITCLCGWHWAGRSVLEIETRWKLHKKETAA